MGLSQSICRFVLLPSTIAVVSYACRAAVESSPEVALEVSEQETTNITTGKITTDAIDPDKVITDQKAVDLGNGSDEATDVAEKNAYQDGIRLASSAHSLSQSAISPDDWGLVASRWQRASNQLGLVSADSEYYSAAQTKMAEYLLNAQYASERIASLNSAARAPLSSNSPAVSTHSNQSNQRSQASSSNFNSNSNSTAHQSGMSQPSSVIAASTVIVPVVRRLHGTPVVQVKFNEATTYEMILDTGASRTLITRTMADELGVVPNDQMIATTASESQVVFDLGQIRSISLGAARLTNAQVSIGDSVDIGLLGNDFLRGYDVTIRDREVELIPAR